MREGPKDRQNRRKLAVNNSLDGKLNPGIEWVSFHFGIGPREATDAKNPHK